jgi:hypothetical protein
LSPGRPRSASEKILYTPAITKPVVYITLDPPRDAHETEWRFYFGNGFGYTTTVVHREM